MMIRKITLAAAAFLGLSGGFAVAAEGAFEPHTTDVAFSFEGPFGTFDRNQLQRGLQVYTEVCSACHGLQHVAIRALSEEGGPQLPEDQVRAYAEQFDIFDPALDDTRPRTPNDHFPMSGMENAPDLSLMAKARAGFHGPYGTGINQLFRGIGGPEHLYSILTGYTGNKGFFHFLNISICVKSGQSFTVHCLGSVSIALNSFSNPNLAVSGVI
jgi:ubiquinol-cytochrome c reductase cytochrome c1 subunit